MRIDSFAFLRRSSDIVVWDGKMKTRLLGRIAPLVLFASVALAPVAGLSQELPSLTGMVPTETVCKDVAGFPATALTDGNLETLWQTSREIAPCHFVFRFDEPIAVASVLLHNHANEGGQTPAVRATIWASHQGFGRGYFRVAHDALNNTGPTRIVFDEPVLMRTLKIALENSAPFSSNWFYASLAEIEIEAVPTDNVTRWPMPRLAPLKEGDPIISGSETHCDNVAAFPYNPDSYGYGREDIDLDVNEALAACRSAVANNPESKRLAFQLARVEANAELSVQSVARLGSELLRTYPPAQYLLAEALRNGTGIAQDEERHLTLHQSAAEAGFLPSRLRLAMEAENAFTQALVLGEQEPLGAKEPLETHLAMLMDAEYLPAYALYNDYVLRTGVSTLLAFMPRLEELAEYNVQGSLFQHLYNHQHGIPPARRRSIRWITERSKRYHTPESLGDLAVSWGYVYSNNAAAIKFARRGSYSGNSWPVQQLAEKLGGQAATRLYAFAFRASLSGAQDGDRELMFHAAEALIMGKGVEKNREEGARWMRLAAAAGESRSITYLKQNPWAQDTGANNQ